MDLSFLVHQEEQIKQNLVKHFREKLYDKLNKSNQVVHLDTEWTESYLISSLTEFLMFMGINTVQDVKIRIIENMSDDDLYQYIDCEHKLDEKLKKCIRKFRNNKLSVEGLDTLLSELGVGTRFY